MKMKCPECSEGTIQKVTIENYQAKLKGISFPVENAEVGKCDHCNTELYNAKEIYIGSYAVYFIHIILFPVRNQ